MYQLYPPIFIVPEESNFPDSWEVFCCKLLNIENKTAKIVRRLPPESGVDLFDPTNKIAYQCKSVENGLTIGFNITLIKKSYNSALTIKASLGWTKYVVCINTDLTGNQLENFKAELPDVEILTRSYWITLCENNPLIVQANFKKIIPIPPQRVEEKIEELFVSSYSEKLRQLLNIGRFDLLFYSNRHSSVYRIPVSKEFQVKDIINILRELFDLPKPMTFDDRISVRLSYAIVLGDNKITLTKTLEEAGISEDSIITFWQTIKYSEGSKKTESTTMQCLTTDMIKQTLYPVESALNNYRAMISKAFQLADKKLLG